MNYEQAIERGTKALSSTSESPRIDAYALLTFVTGKTKTQLLTWPEHTLNAEQMLQWDACLQRRIQGEPIAYITGEREFWSLPLKTSPATLIPRPDTEVLVETLLSVIEVLDENVPKQLLDLGTGTGAIALAFASECADWHIDAVDKSSDAVSLAQLNANGLKIENVNIYTSDWFENVPKKLFGCIVSNPPYIDTHDAHLDVGDVRFEPRSALVSADSGYADIVKIVDQSRQYLAKGGWLLIEHGFQQGDRVMTIFRQFSFNDVKTIRDYSDNPRLTIGRFSGNLSR